MNRTYIGLATTFHDTAIAFVDSNGTVLFAEATERSLQAKRSTNVAPDGLHRTAELIERYCDPQSELVLAFSWSAQKEGRNRQVLKEVEEQRQAIRRLYDRPPTYALTELAIVRYQLLSHLCMNMLAGEAIDVECGRLGRLGTCRVSRRHYDHHLTHAANACISSPFNEAVCAIVDGFGETGAYSFYNYKDGRLTPIETAAGSGVVHTGSLGVFYDMVCRTCGFDDLLGEEWKVMGLAAYGHHDPQAYKVFREMIGVRGLELTAASSRRQFLIHHELEGMRRMKNQAPRAAANIAYTGQQVFTETLYALLNNLHALGTSKNLVLGGGCALNSSANGGILEHTPFEALFVPSAPADDGNAIGAALLAYLDDHPAPRAAGPPQTPYLGSQMPGETLRNVERFGGFRNLKACGGGAPEMAAQLLSQGKIIGWIQGRAEFGPRALGNRSILADPRSREVKEQINARVKFREEFRPFAPSILHEHGPQYIERYQESPYMERALKFRREAAQRVPGVVHEDGTGRLQTVKYEWNAPYYRLISRFQELTDVPVILNTSYNVMGKPIAHSVEDVLAVFCTSGLDAVFIDDVMIEK